MDSPLTTEARLLALVEQLACSPATVLDSELDWARDLRDLRRAEGGRIGVDGREGKVIGTFRRMSDAECDARDLPRGTLVQVDGTLAQAPSTLRDSASHAARADFQHAIANAIRVASHRVEASREILLQALRNGCADDLSMAILGALAMAAEDDTVSDALAQVRSIVLAERYAARGSTPP